MLLLRPNCVVTVSQVRTGQDASGLNAQQLAPVATGVPALYTLATGDRDSRFAGDADFSGGSLTGTDPSLGRQDTAVTVTAVMNGGPAALVGMTARVASVASHPGSNFGLIKPRYTAQLSAWEPTA